MENVSKELFERSDEKIAEMSPDEIRMLLEENEHLRQELRIRDNDILSHDQVFDSIVRGTFHIILVMSVTTYKAEFITTNIETALGISRAEAMQDVRRIGNSFENIEEYNGRDEIYIHRTNGTRRQYQVYVIHLPYGRSDRVAVVLLCRSSAPTSDLEEMMIRQTQDVNKAAGYFLASMSHDFRVPISTISGFVMLLMKNSENPSKVLEYSHRIGMACQELLSTVDQILDMSRIESVETGLESEEFGLGLMLEEICSTFSSLAKANSQRFIFTSEGIEHDIVIGDKARIMEMLRGVLSNAVKYTPAGGCVELTVRGTPGRSDEDGNDDEVSLVFEIRDTGIGMDQDQLECYFRSDTPESTENAPGPGTGIWLTRKLIDMMGGRISAQSRPGEGTIIWIRLNLKIVNIGSSDFWKEHGIRRMAVINGNIQEGARIRNLLESAGVETMSTSSGFGTIKLVEQGSAHEKPFDVILLDEELQDMEWQELVSSLRSMSWLQIPMIILMSSRQIRDEEWRGIGLSRVIQKPFYISALHKVVEEICEKRTGDSLLDIPEEGNSMVGLRFLVAEDNAMNADMLKELVEMTGARCEIAGNGRAALAMFSNSRPGFYTAILMDIQMPVMDGYAAAKAIRALPRQDARTIPIFAMTASTSEEDIQKSFEAGMNAYIAKPLDVRVLQANMRKLKQKES